MAFGSVEGVKAILRSAPPRGDAFIVVGGGAYDIAETEIVTLLAQANDYIVLKLGFTPAATAVTMDLVANYFAAYHAYLRVFSSGAEPMREIPDQIKRWMLWVDSILEDEDIKNNLVASVTEELLEPDILCSELIRVQDEAISLSIEDCYLDVTPILNGSELVYSGKKGAGTLYTRNKDYRIWYPDGRVRRIATGDIPLGQIIYVTYYASRKRAFLDTLGEALR